MSRRRPPVTHEDALQTSFVDLCCCALGGLILLMMLLVPVPGADAPDEAPMASLDVEIRLPVVRPERCRDDKIPKFHYDTIPAFGTGDRLELKIGADNLVFAPHAGTHSTVTQTSTSPEDFTLFYHEQGRACDHVEQVVFRFQTNEREPSDLLPARGVLVASLSIPAGIGETQFEHWRALARAAPGWSSPRTEAPTAPSVAVGVRPGSGGGRRSWYLPRFHVHEPDNCRLTVARWGPLRGEEAVERDALATACRNVNGCKYIANVANPGLTAAGRFHFAECPLSSRLVTKIEMTWTFAVREREDESGGEDVEIWLKDIKAIP